MRVDWRAPCGQNRLSCDHKNYQPGDTMASSRMRILVSAGAIALLATTACTRPAAQVDMQRLLGADAEPGQWMTHSRTFDEQYFSPLAQINEDNIGELGLAWYVDLPTNQNVETTPLMIDGVLYVTLPWSMVMAVDAKTGKQLWLHDPKVDRAWNGNICCGVDNRGVAAWNGRIFFGTLDGRLIALDAKTGDEVWSIKATPDERRYSMTSAPRIANGKLFVGSAGAEFDVRGYIDAYDVETGKRLWRFWTIPGDPAKGFENDAMKMAAETWKTPGWWEEGKGGGGTVWDAITYDPTTDLVIFGTGNATPGDAVRRDPGRGDNLFTTSIVALHAEDGSYAWHYQPTPWETWDYDNVQQLMLLDVEIDGQQRHTVMQAAKNGMFYVLDAKTGELLSAKAYTDVNWNTGVDMKTGRPNVVKAARYEEEPWNVAPGPPGGHTWHPNAFSPLTGLIYIPTWQNYGLNTPQTVAPGATPPLISFGGRADPATLKPHNKNSDEGWLQAWDPVTRKVVWETPKGRRATSGALATGGNLVFMGNSQGKQLKAYNARTGQQLWEFDAQADVYAGPISFELDGVQYIAASVGGTGQGDYFAPGYGRMLVFKVGGTAKLPPNAPFTPRPLNPPPATASAEVVAHGGRVYADNCSVCHGANATPGGGRGSNAPDLGTSPFIQNQAVFDTVVLQGQRLDKGMPSFSDKLSADDANAVRAYVVSRANERKNAPPAPAGGRGFGGPGGAGPGAPRAGGAPRGAPPAPPPSDDVHQQAAGQ